MLEARQKSTTFNSKPAVEVMDDLGNKRSIMLFPRPAVVMLKKVNPASERALRVFLANRIEVNLVILQDILET